MISTTPFPPPEPITDEAQAFTAAQRLIAAERWPEARQVAHRLACIAPANRQYRALFALVLGYEAESEGDSRRARAEFRRATTLDPKLAARPEIRRRARASLLDRLFGR
jgi:Flp pilus assembly protein TadD